MDIPTIVGVRQERMISMAEFCIECWNKLTGNDLPADKYILSEELDLCEECGQIKHVVIMEKKYYSRRKCKKLWRLLDILWRIMMIPYVYYKYRNTKK